MRKKNLNDCLV